jgi:hypothetical protein
MGIQLTQTQIDKLKGRARTETDREIYSIRFDGRRITINGDWSIERDGTDIDKNIVSAIEAYCTVANIEWEYNATYSAWCD